MRTGIRAVAVVAIDALEVARVGPFESTDRHSAIDTEGISERRAADSVRPGDARIGAASETEPTAVEKESTQTGEVTGVGEIGSIPKPGARHALGVLGIPAFRWPETSGADEIRIASYALSIISVSETPSIALVLAQPTQCPVKLAARRRTRSAHGGRDVGAVDHNGARATGWNHALEAVLIVTVKARIAFILASVKPIERVVQQTAPVASNAHRISRRRARRKNAAGST